MKLFVWDLHGTLEEGNERAVIEISNRILEEFGYPERFTDRHIRELYGLKWYQYFERLLPGLGHDQHLELQAACFKLSNSTEGVAIISQHMKPSRNALEVLKAVAESPHSQVLLSNTMPESLPIFINELRMKQFFDQSNALAINVHSREARCTKKDVLAAYIEGKEFDDFVIIGDSDADMELLDVVGGRAYLYAHRGIPHRSVRGTRIDDLAEVLGEV